MERPTVRRGGRGGPGAVEEAEQQELTCPGGQLLEVPAGQVDRHHTWRLGHDGRDNQPVPQRAVGRQSEAVDHDRGGRACLRRPPVAGREGVGEEVRAGPQLVRQGETDPEVGVEVH